MIYLKASPVPEEGVWWCNAHQREATYIREDGKRCCDPSLPGIMLPCVVVFAPVKIVEEVSDEALIAEWQDRADAHSKGADKQRAAGNLYGEMSHHGSFMAYKLAIYELKERQFVFQQNKPRQPDPNWVYPGQSYEEPNL